MFAQFFGGGGLGGGGGEGFGFGGGGLGGAPARKAWPWRKSGANSKLVRLFPLALGSHHDSRDVRAQRRRATRTLPGGDPNTGVPLFPR